MAHSSLVPAQGKPHWRPMGLQPSSPLSFRGGDEWPWREITLFCGKTHTHMCTHVHTCTQEKTKLLLCLQVPASHLRLPPPDYCQL